MIDEIDFRLKEWIATVIDSNFQVSFEHPGKIDNQPTVSIYLYNLSNSLPTSVAREIPFQINLSYLLTVQSENHLEAHQMLGELLFSAKEQTDFEVEFPSLPADYWQSFGTVPLPYFIIRLILVKARKSVQAPTIVEPPRVDIGTLISIDGVVLGADNIPVSAAKITEERTKIISYTDRNGCFSIATDSASRKKFDCKVDVKGKQFRVSIPIQKTKNKPITIHLDTIEV
ncbi:MAG: hypothetical protein ACKE51_06645 [Methylococcaceae bacterium]